MWVILCSTVWTLYSSESAASKDYEEFVETAAKNGCTAPKFANDLEVEHYRSKAFAPSLNLGGLSGVHEDDKYVEATWKVQAAVDEQPAVTAPSPTPTPPPVSDSKEKHCEYSFVRTGPKSLRMITKCDK